MSKLNPINQNDDKHGMNLLTIPLLKDELWARGLSLFGKKLELHNRMVNFLKLQVEEVVDDTVDNTDEDKTEDDLVGIRE